MDEILCPFCQNNNLCGNLKRDMEHPSELGSPSEVFDCWCLHTEIPSAALESLTAEQRGKSCICQACAQAFNTTTNLSSSSGHLSSENLSSGNLSSGKSGSELGYPVGCTPLR